MTRGQFIVLEGGEGSGKSGAARRIDALLRGAGIDVALTREPGGTPGAEVIRDILIRDSSDYDPITNALLFAAARRDHVERLIRPSLEAGRWIVSDRYVLSTYAYQGAGEGVSLDTLKSLHRIGSADLLPDLTIVMDVDPRIGIRRSLDRLGSEGSAEGRFEKFDIGFHDRMREAMLAYDLSPKVVIDASDDMETVQKAVDHAVMRHLRRSRAIETGAEVG